MWFVFEKSTHVVVKFCVQKMRYAGSQKLFFKLVKYAVSRKEFVNLMSLSNFAPI